MTTFETQERVTKETKYGVRLAAAYVYGSTLAMREIYTFYLINKKIKKSVDKQQKLMYNKYRVKERKAKRLKVKNYDE